MLFTVLVQSVQVSPQPEPTNKATDSDLPTSYKLCLCVPRGEVGSVQEINYPLTTRLLRVMTF